MGAGSYLFFHTVVEDNEAKEREGRWGSGVGGQGGEADAETRWNVKWRLCQKEDERGQAICQVLGTPGPTDTAKASRQLSAEPLLWTVNRITLPRHLTLHGSVIGRWGHRAASPHRRPPPRGDGDSWHSVEANVWKKTFINSEHIPLV